MRKRDDFTIELIKRCKVKIKTMINKPVLAIDFDDTIAENDFPYCGDMIDGAAEVINYLYKLGFEILIFTCRQSDEHVKNAKKFLSDNGINYDCFNKNCEELIEKYGVDSRKLGADLYIDDKTIGFSLLDWRDKLEVILFMFSDFINRRPIICEMCCGDGYVDENESGDLELSEIGMNRAFNIKAWVCPKCDGEGSVYE